MRKSIILYTLLCAVSSGVSVAHAAVYDQVTQEYTPREPAISPFKPITDYLKQTAIMEPFIIDR